MVRYIVYLLFILWIKIGFTQSPYYISINKSKGLPNNTTYDILQDKKGFIWIASNEGLIRYDGNEYKIYTNKLQTSLAGSSLMEDKYGRIWMQNFDGYLYYIENDQLLALKQSEPLDYFTQGIVGDRLYIRTLQGFDIFDLKSLKKIDNLSFHWDKYIHSFIPTSKNIFYFLNKDKVFQINEKHEVKPYADLPKEYGIWQFGECNGNLYFASRENGKEIYTIQNNKTKLFATLDTEVQILGIECIKNEVWVLTSNGAYAFDFKGNKIKSEIFKEKKISSLYKDQQENYWFTTLLDGIYLVPDMEREIVSLNTFKPLKMIPSNDGFIIGTKNHHVLELNSNFDIKKTIYRGIENADVYYLYQHPTEKTIFFSSNGATMLLGGNPKHVFDLELAIKEICIVDEKYYALAASGVAGLFLNPLAKKTQTSEWDNIYKKNQLVEYYSGLANNLRAKSVVYYAPKKMLYFATNQGLLAFKSNGKEEEILWEGKRIFAQKIEQFKNTILILTTSGSLLQLTSEHKIIPLENKLNLTDIQIKQIKVFGNELILRSNANLYIATEEKGHWKTQLNDVNLSNFDVYDIEKQGEKLILISNQGILKLKSEFKKQKTSIPRLHINYILVNDSLFKPTKQLQLKHEENNILVHISVLNFGKVWKNQLFYRINNGTWKPISKDERELKFASLSPGLYTISFSWKDKSRFIFKENISFKIAEPFYKQYWFLISSFLLIVLVISLYYRWQVRLLNKKNRLLTEKIQLEKNLSKSILTSIKAQMNPHFFYNALNTIQSYIFINDKRNASSYLAKFSKLTRMILEMSDKETISLADELKALNLYLELEKMRFEEGFEFSIEIDQNLDTDLHKIPSMLIQPYVENAIKHGLLHKEGSKKLNISFKKEDKYLLVEVLDNGVGRKKSESIQKIKTDKHQSFSTTANQKRLDILNQGTETKVSVEIIDLYENQIATGTLVKLRITLQ